MLPTYFHSCMLSHRTWLAWSWELGFKAPPCESCQLIYLFLSSGSSWCVIQKLLKEQGWVNLWFSSFENTLEVLFHILPSCGSEIGLMRLIGARFWEIISASVENVPQLEGPCPFLQNCDTSCLGPDSPWCLFLSLRGEKCRRRGGKHNVSCGVWMSSGKKITCILSLSQRYSGGAVVTSPSYILPMAAQFCKAH